MNTLLSLKGFLIQVTNTLICQFIRYTKLKQTDDKPFNEVNILHIERGVCLIQPPLTDINEMIASEQKFRFRRRLI